MTKLKTVEEVATETWALIYEGLMKDKVKFPNNFDGIGAAYGGYARIIEAITQDRQSLHTSLVAAVEGIKLTKEDYEKSDFATYSAFCAYMNTHNATVTKTLTIINSIFKE